MRLVDQLDAIRQRIRANPTGRVTLRIGVGLLGAIVVTIGIILIPFPGPGWLIVLFGLAIWAAEFAWAARLLSFTKGRLESWWHWIGRQQWTVRIIIGLVGLGFVGAVVLTSLYFTFDVRSWGDLVGLITPS
jgi:uncharacterized protein (TIGR02611 family)